MNQVERIIDVTIAQRELAQLGKDLQELKLISRVAENILKDKKATTEVRAAAQIALDDVTPKIGSTKGRIAGTKRYINDLDHQAAGDASVRLITGSLFKAEIAISYQRDNGKKISYTRHVVRQHDQWVGRSTLTDSLVVYRLPGDSVQQAEAA